MDRTSGMTTARSRATDRRPILHGVVVLGLLLLLTLSATAGRVATVAAQDAPGALGSASVMPETALLYVSLSLDQESAQWQKSAELAELAGFDALFDQALGESDAPSDEDLADIEPFLGGEAAFVVHSLVLAESMGLGDFADDLSIPTAEPVAGGPSGVAAVVRAADPDAAFAKAEELLTEDADGNGATVEEADYNGVTIITGDETAIARVDDFLLVSGTATDLEPLIDTSAGDIGSLADLDDFTAVRDQLNDEFMLFGYVNGPALKEGIESPELEDVAELLGGNLDALDAFTGFVMWADDPGFRLDTLSIPNGDLTLPGGANADLTLDERVPADTLLFTSGLDLGASGFLDAVGLLFIQGFNQSQDGEDSDGTLATPPAGVSAEEFVDQQYAEAAETLGFNLKTDFIDQMVGEFGLALRVSNFLDPNGIGAIFVSGVDDEGAVTDVLSKASVLLTAGLGDSTTTTYTTRDLDGDRINVIEDTSTGFPIKVEYGVVGDEFVVGFGSSLDDYVAGATDTLADNPQYQAVMGTLPAENSSITYVDLAQIVAFAEAFLGTTGGDDFAVEDASPDCAEYDTQADAQEAYDEDPSGLIELDQDFDGEACEDAFGGAATPEAAAGPPDFSAIRALASVQFAGEDGMRGSSSILYIEDQGEE